MDTENLAKNLEASKRFRIISSLLAGTLASIAQLEGPAGFLGLAAVQAAVTIALMPGWRRSYSSALDLLHGIQTASAGYLFAWVLTGAVGGVALHHS